jgi:glycosyltransferase involved in cell wall biosynthesis
MRLACVPVCNYFTADNRVLRTCRFLLRHGFEVHVLAIGRAGLPQYELVDGVHVHRFHSGSDAPIRRGLNLRALRAYSAFVAGSVQWARRHRPELIHYNDWNTLFIGPLARIEHRAIYDMHELFQDLDYLNFPRPINQLIAAIDREGLRRAEAVICVSPPIQEELSALTRKPVYVVRNVPTARVADGLGVPEVAAHMRDGRKHLVFLGALRQEKGALHMLELLSRLPPEFVLDCLSGVGARHSFFTERAAALGVTSRVRIFEYVPAAELYATIGHAFAGISLFVPSSRIYDYALPNKLFEYFLAGLPVVTSGARAQAELVTENNLGLVVDLANPEASARRLATWTPPVVDRIRVEALGLTWEHEERVLERVYRELGIVS